MQPSISPNQLRRWEVVALLVLAAATALLAFANLDFPLGHHADEPLKVEFVASGEQNFHHPILLLQLARLGSRLAGADEDVEIVMVGRALSATSAVALVLIVFVLARSRRSPFTAVAAAAIVGLSPIVTVHAHYFKEDMLFTLAVTLALLAGVRAEERPTHGRLVVLGIALGLAASTKYVGALLAPLLLVRTALVAHRRGGRPLAAAALPLAVAMAVFALVNYPIFLEFGAFRTGLGFELRHMTTGHGPVAISPLAWGFAFHLLHSLLPGLTFPVGVLALASLLAHLFTWPRISGAERLLVLTTLLFYLSAELSPTKPFPDFMRYMLPVVPPLAILVSTAVGRAAAANRKLGRIAALVLAAAVAWSGVVSVRLVAGIEPDTRTLALRWLEKHQEPWRGETFTPDPRPLPSVALVDVDAMAKEGSRYLVASSFLYDQAFVGCRSGPCDGRLKVYFDGYQRLFSYPYTEIRPHYRTFAFSNPVLRIVDIGGARSSVGDESVSDE
jgi:hypothetical protein